jgi:hypothetical protein
MIFQKLENWGHELGGLREWEKAIFQAGRLLNHGVAGSRRENIGLFQATLSVPIKGAGVKIPISITASNMTELIKESIVRGTIGITLDIDSLFAK